MTSRDPRRPPDDDATRGDATTRVGPFSPGGNRLEIGTVFDRNRYRIEGFLGAGGMGEVYRAADLKLGETVALKVIHAHLLPGTNGIERLRNEVRIARRLIHPGIVRVLELGTDEGLEFYTMEYVEGCTLREAMAKRRGPFTLDETARVLLPLLAALAYAHEQGTVHRDVKPENVLLVGGDLARPKLTDFGIAKALDVATLTRTALGLGTPEYVAPEQSRDAAHVDARADLYSVGVMLYEMLTGVRPAGVFEPPSELTTGLPQAVDRLVHRLLQRQPERRPGSAAEVRITLAAIAEQGERANGAAVDAEPPLEQKPDAGKKDEGAVSAVEEKVTRSKRRFRLVAALGLGAVAAVSLLALVLARGLPDGTRDSPPADDGTPSGTRKDSSPPPSTTGPKEDTPNPAPLAAPVSSDGWLVVRSDVAGAEVVIDNESAGEPGPTEHPLKAGTHRVTVSKSGYEAISINVEVTAGHTNEQLLNPKPRVTTGRIIVRSSVSGDTVSIDGKQVGPSGPQAHDIAPGHHRLRVEKAGYEAWEQVVQVEREQQFEVRAELKALPPTRATPGMAPVPPPAQPASAKVTGEVLETMSAGNYTYVRVKTASGGLWAAGPRIEVKVGDTVSFQRGIAMSNFHSKALDRSFDSIDFIGRFVVGDNKRDAASSSLDLSGIAKAKNRKTVAAVFDGRAALSGREVSVRGKVVKVNTKVMGHNWLHVRDGTKGADGSDDLPLTTEDTAKVGDTVVVRGKVVTDKDFGFGYHYAVMLEEAKVTVE